MLDRVLIRAADKTWSDSWACVFLNLQILGGCFCFESNRHHTQRPRGAMVTFALLALAFAERIR